MKITPVKSNIVFQFVDAVNAKGEFVKERTEAGIILQASFDDSAKLPRWARVVAVGPKVEKVKAGQMILLPALRWTMGAKYSGQTIWQTAEKEVVAVRESDSNNIAAFPEYVIFKRHKTTITKSTSGLLFVDKFQTNESARGSVVLRGTDVAEEVVKGTMFYFNDANFFDNFTHDGVELSFIKQDDILAICEA